MDTIEKLEKGLIGRNSLLSLLCYWPCANYGLAKPIVRSPKGFLQILGLWFRGEDYEALKTFRNSQRQQIQNFGCKTFISPNRECLFGFLLELVSNAKFVVVSVKSHAQTFQIL